MTDPKKPLEYAHALGWMMLGGLEKNSWEALCSHAADLYWQRRNSIPAQREASDVPEQTA